MNIDKLSDKQLLIDLRLTQGENITVAALVLLAKGDSLKRLLPYVEVRFGYKISSAEIRNQDSEIYSEGYLLFYDKIWQKINSRNNIIHIPQGMLLMDKKTFDEETIREAINNAILHRDYSVNETIFVIQTPNSINIKSPGGFPDGVNIDNIINESKPRNKLIADTLYKCDFVEHFGNGVNLMYQKQLSLGKNPPDYSFSDENRVALNLDGMIKDMEFAKYVFRVANEKQKVLNDQELIILNAIKENKKIKASQIAGNLLDLELVERVGYGKYVLSKKYYDYTNKKGEYTRRKGLDREVKKMLIIEHLKNYKRGYMKEFVEVLKDTPKPTITKYLNELKKDGKIEFVGNPKISKGENASFWRIK
ncbi:MAG: ATP-binding protein [bacterium]